MSAAIASFFRQIGQADELGSGMRNLMKYGKAYGAADPELVEGDIFRIVVKTPEKESGETSGETRGTTQKTTHEEGWDQLGNRLGNQLGNAKGFSQIRNPVD